MLDYLSSVISNNPIMKTENGHKLAPYKVNPSTLVTELADVKNNDVYRTHFIFEKGGSYTAQPITLRNFGENAKYNYSFVGDGAQIQLTNNQGMLFNSIDDKSYISGLTINTNNSAYPEPYNSTAENVYEYKYRDNKNIEKTYTYPINIYGGLAAVNHGVIFGSNVKANKQISDISQDNSFYSQVFLQNTHLAGGLVGLNKGFISDSFASTNLVNLTDLTVKDNVTQYNENLFEAINREVGNKFINYDTDLKTLSIRPITSGFVGINEGDINSSYSNGVISAFSSITFAFGADNKNIRFSSSSNETPSVKNSFTITQSSNAYSEITLNGKETKTEVLANVFGYGADSTNFYDIYATQVKNKYETVQAKVSLNVVNNGDNDNFSNIFETSQVFDYSQNLEYNFGYPTFLNAYSANNNDFEFMRQKTANNSSNNSSTYLVPNLGVLQTLSKILNDSTEKEIYLINDMEITEDMGWVSYNQKMIKASEKYNENWDGFALIKAKIYGLGNMISGFKVFASKDYNEDKKFFGFFTEIKNSTVSNMILSKGEVVTDLLSNDISQGSFAGVLENSTLENSYNLGVSVIADKCSIIGGLVGKVTTSLVEGKKGTSVITKSVNAGTVSSVEKVYKEEQSYFAVAGGIFGLAESGVELANINNNTNYGFVHVSKLNTNGNNPVNEVAKVAGIGTFDSIETVGENTNINNQMLGVGMNIAYDREDSTKQTTGRFDEYFNIETTLESSIETINPTEEVIMIGDGSKDKPFIINTPFQFEKAYNQFMNSSEKVEFNIVLNTNVDLAQIGVNPVLNDYGISVLFKEDDQGVDANIFGNNKILLYKNTGFSESPQASFIRKLSKDSKIVNLNLLATHKNILSNSSLLVNENNGLIRETNVFGSLLPKNDKLYQEGINSEPYLAGIALKNMDNGRIELSNNFALVKAISGKDGTESASGVSAPSIGGIAGKTSGNIINSINYGTLIGGNGGQGFGYNEPAINERKAELQKKGETGRNGTNGGDASLIGGVVAKAELNSITTGNNLGIIIGGNGGKGGDGEEGGEGGDGVAAYAEFYVGVTTTSIADLSAAWERLKGIFVKGKGGAGGGGGAGGNGGNTIAGGIAGVSYSNSISSFSSKSSLNPVLISGTPGLGGKGGDGGNGGKGTVAIETITATLITTNIASLLLPPYTTTVFEIAVLVAKINGMALNYKNAGDGGGAGGTGFSGNTIETIQNAFIINDVNKTINAQPGGEREDPTIYGVGSQSIEAMTGEYGYTKSQTKFLNAIGADVENFHKVAIGGKGQTAKQNATFNAISNYVGFSPSLPNYNETEKHYEVDSWMDLVNLLAGEETLKGEKVYKLNKSFSFGESKEDSEYVSPIWRTLSNYEGTIDGGGQTIYIKGSYSDIKLLNSISNKLKNITINLDVSNFQANYTGKDQFISTPVENQSFNLTKNNVEIIGIIKTSKTIPWLREKYGVVDLPGTQENFTFTGAVTELTGIGSNENPYIISSDNGFKEFVSLIKETDSKAYYNLEKDITLTPEAVKTFVIDTFLGNFDGNGNTIYLSMIEEDEKYHPYLSLFGNLGNESLINQTGVKNLKIRGAFFLAGIANVNYGIISNVTIGEKLDKITSSSSIAGVVVDNFGTITNTTNNINLESTGSQTLVAGISLTNSGKLLNVTNNGSISATKGEASGITITNTGLIDGALNYANVTAGEGIPGTSFDNMSEKDKKSYEDMHKDENEVLDEVAFNEFKSNLLNGSKGNDAAGIAIYNYLEKEDSKEVDFFENDALKFGITGVKNEGIIKAGKGGQPLTGGIVGADGIASGIVVYNVFETLLPDDDNKYKTVIYIGYVYSYTNEEEPLKNREVINSGEIINGNDVAVTDEKLKIISINEIILDGITFTGLYDGFAWVEPPEE
jgi:hypothetical protein